MELLLLQSSAYLHISSCEDPSFSCYHCLLLLGNGVGVPCCEPSEPFIRQSTPFPSTDSLFGQIFHSRKQRCIRQSKQV
ncbi:uncharacterized protein LOC131330893 isoform X4 [Rhododendron vialii]|uniref:uncharacterized protein LOC131330893 isoform X4 n=1 Tax=Rhododendron vialii TaxID=182163 RepID=UPI0026604D0A|nr:uncharacterized protein LOC131330893 isoform X4 [Rhododendron vialii]